jgi:glutaredoxin
MILNLIRQVLGRAVLLISYLTRPKPMARSEEDQARVEKEAESLALYQFHLCPFCIKVRSAIHGLNVSIAMRDARSEPHRSDLEAGGGRIKAPCLRIEGENDEVQWMYESKDIIHYLSERFA